MNIRNLLLPLTLLCFITNNTKALEPFCFPLLAGMAVGAGATAALDLFIPRHVGIFHHDDNTSTLMINGKLFNLFEQRIHNNALVIIEDVNGNYSMTTVREFEGQENSFIDNRSYAKLGIIHVRAQTRHHFQDSDTSKDLSEDYEAHQKIDELLTQQLGTTK